MAALTTGLRGRLAPTPTGLLHAGHARTFALAASRAGDAGLVLRIEDIDGPRCRAEFVAAATADLRWLGLAWTEGPDMGGPHAPYEQSRRTAWYLDVWRRLEAAGVIYPSPHSRRDVEQAATAPHDADAEPLFPTALRPARRERAAAPGGVPWRFRVPDGRAIEFDDALAGRVCRTAGVDFGDFVIWRRDDLPAYQFVSVVDDRDLGVTHIVRGRDLLPSSAAQVHLAPWLEAEGVAQATYVHHELVTDASGAKLSKSTLAQGLREEAAP